MMENEGFPPNSPMENKLPQGFTIVPPPFSPYDSAMENVGFDGRMMVNYGKWRWMDHYMDEYIVI